MDNDSHPTRTTPAGIERKLAAILHADVQGYSRLLGEDEMTTLRTVASYLGMMRTRVGQHGGRALGSRGDSLLAEFLSVVAAVQCAMEVQRELQVRNAEVPIARRVEFRIGINLGEVVVEGEEIYGEGVNIAVRLEGLAAAGGMCISEAVYDQIKNRLGLKYEELGERILKNIDKPVRVWRVREPGAAPSRVGEKPSGGPAAVSRAVVVLMGVLIVGGLMALLYPSLVSLRTYKEALPLPDKPSLAVLPFLNMSGDQEQEYFSDGMTEDLITDLSKLSGLFVIARNSVFTYKGKAVNVGEISRELGVRYVLEGGVRKVGDRVRITLLPLPIGRSQA